MGIHRLLNQSTLPLGRYPLFATSSRLLLVVVTLISACGSTSLDKQIVGMWEPVGAGHESLEFFPDGRIILYSGNEPIVGQYSFLEGRASRGEDMQEPEELSDEQVAELRGDLLELQRALVGTLAAAEESSKPVPLDQSSVGRLSRMDAMQVQAMAQANLRSHRLRLQQVEQALRLLDEEEYGYCRHCEELIGQRLTPPLRPPPLTPPEYTT